MADAYTRSYGDATTSQFPKMGEHPLVGSLVNTSGERRPYTMDVARKGPSTDSESEPSAVRPVGPTATGENAGPRFRPMTTIMYPNSAESAQTTRGLRVVPSSVGNRDFWEARMQGGYQTGEVIDEPTHPWHP